MQRVSGSRSALVIVIARNENGEWYRDETVEFDSDDEPDLATLLSSSVK